MEQYQKNSKMEKLNILFMNSIVNTVLQNNVEESKEKRKLLEKIRKILVRKYLAYTVLMIGTAITVATAILKSYGMPYIGLIHLDIMLFAIGIEEAIKVKQSEVSFQRDNPESENLLYKKISDLEEMLNKCKKNEKNNEIIIRKKQIQNYKLMKRAFPIQSNIEKELNQMKKNNTLPLSVEELNHYKELLVCFQNQNEYPNLESGYMNTSIKNNGLYNETVYEFTISGKQKKKI